MDKIKKEKDVKVKKDSIKLARPPVIQETVSE